MRDTKWEMNESLYLYQEIVHIYFFFERKLCTYTCGRGVNERTCPLGHVTAHPLGIRSQVNCFQRVCMSK